MLNAQISMRNERGNSQWINALNHFYIDYSLLIEHLPAGRQGCLLNIETAEGQQ